MFLEGGLNQQKDMEAYNRMFVGPECLDGIAEEIRRRSKITRPNLIALDVKHQQIRDTIEALEDLYNGQARVDRLATAISLYKPMQKP